MAIASCMKMALFFKLFPLSRGDKREQAAETLSAAC
jgi:hypothetical protein